MAEAAPGHASSLWRRAIVGSGFEVLGFGTAQILRLANNLILTRILTPEAFGLAALVTLFNTGLFMFSDLGFLPAVVQHERGGEPRFLNTAWTLQILRGILLTVVAVALAWPMALLYNEPELRDLLLVGAIGSLGYSFTSTSIYSLRRSVRAGPVVALELGVQVFAIAVLIPLSLWLKSVWALVFGLVLSGWARAAFSYLLPTTTRHELCWDREAVKAILGFGKWIFMSSSLTFISRQGDRLLLGKLLGVTELGVYSIAVMLSDAMSELVNRVTHGVVFPLFSRVREEGQDKLAAAFYRTRAALDVISLPALGALGAVGSWIIDLLYDERYQAAGWMLEALVVRVAMSCMLTPCETCLYALGKTRYSFWQGVCRTTWIAVMVPLGFYLWGIKGLIWAMTLSELPNVFVLWWPLWRAGILRLRREAIAVCLFVAGFALATFVESLLHR